MKRRWWLGLLGIATVLLSEHASAQEAVSPASDSVKTVRRWYGWQTLTVDAAALGVMVGGVALSRQEVPVLAGIGTYALGAPIVHLAQREPWRAAGSLGIRVGLPLLVGDLVARADPARCPGRNEDEDFECQDQLGKMAAGIVVSVLVASAVDAAFLAYKVEPARERAATWTPTLGVERPRDGKFAASLGVAGTF